MIKKAGKRKKSRFFGLNIVIIIIFGSIIAKLIYIQGFKSSDFREQANTKSIKDITEAAPRGNIYDRNGVALATSQQSYSLTFTETDESKKDFITTIEKILQMLKENGEVLQDDMALKVSADGVYSFDFNSQDTNTVKTRQLLFLKDRGFDDWIMSNDNSLKNKKKEELTDDEKAKIDAKLLELTPEQVFNKLWDNYTQYYTKSSKNSPADPAVVLKLAKYTPQEKRQFMIVKDAIWIQSFSGYKPITIAANIKKETAFILSQKLNELPGVDITLQPIRVYPNKDLASSVLGYVSKINPEQKDNAEAQGYDISTDYVGQTGIERAFENILKGSKGEKFVEVNSQGRVTKEKVSKDPYPGNNIQLTIDSNVQLAAEKSLEKVMQNLQNNPNNGDVNTKNATRACAIAVDCKTGKILALANRPGFDPNLFSVPGALTTDLANQYFNIDLEKVGKQYIQDKNIMSNNPGKTLDEVFNTLFPIDKTIKDNTIVRRDYYDVLPKPFYNYATLSLVPPGSTFKPITALAGLDTGVITPSFTINDHGVFDIGYDGNIIKFGSSYPGGVNLYRALEVSSNPFFMTVGHLLIDNFKNVSNFDINKYDTIAKYAWKFGLGAPQNSKEKLSTGIEFPDEENYGQVYNVASATKLNSDLYIINILNLVKNSQNANGNIDKNSYPSLDLSSSDSDSKEVSVIKTQIKDDIRERIKSGNRNAKSLTDLITKLVSIDPKYQNVQFSKENIKEIGTVITEYTYYTAYNGLRTPFYVYNAAIGQGISQFTPLQMASYISTLANGGTRYALHFVDKITDPDGKVIKETKPEVLGTAGINQTYINDVKNGMHLVVNGAEGTANAAFKGFPIDSAGKTGSSTFDSNQNLRGRTSFGLYIGYAPYDDPQIAVCVVVFDGGHGGFVAPVARAMYEAYFKDELKSKYNYDVPELGNINFGASRGD